MDRASLLLVQLLFGLERLAAVAVPALVFALVDVAVVVHLLDELLAADVVPRLAGLDEVVVADLQGAPDLLELAGHVVAVRLGVLAKLRRPLRYLDGVLVVAHEEVDAVALHAAVAGLHVGAELLEGGADVRPAVGVVDGGGQVEARVVGHDSPSSTGAAGPARDPADPARVFLLHSRRRVAGHGFGVKPGGRVTPPTARRRGRATRAGRTGRRGRRSAGGSPAAAARRCG